MLEREQGCRIAARSVDIGSRLHGWPPWPADAMLRCDDCAAGRRARPPKPSPEGGLLGALGVGLEALLPHVDAHHGLAQVAADLGQDGGVVVVGHSLGENAKGREAGRMG